MRGSLYPTLRKIIQLYGKQLKKAGESGAEIVAPRRMVQHHQDMTGSTQHQPAPSGLPFGGAAFIRDKEAAAYLGLCVRSVAYLVTDGKLKRVYPKPRAARLTAESVLAYREAIEEGRPPRIWTQPGNVHDQQQPAPTPEPQPEKKRGLLSRWGLGGD